MKHFYNNIQGWSKETSGFLEAYKEFIANAPSDRVSTLVEIGCWKGRSLAFAAVEAINSKKPIQIFGVDTFEGSDEAAHKKDKDVQDGGLMHTCLKNLIPIFNWEQENFTSMMTVIRGRSDEAHTKFIEYGTDLLCIDGDHSYEAVLSDLIKWWPKVKIGGTVILDDYNWEGVNSAVDQFSSMIGCSVFVNGSGKHRYAEIVKKG